MNSAIERHVQRVELHRITLPPQQVAGLHKHVGGVVGYVLSGQIAFELDAAALVVLGPGDAFVEPAGRHVLRFDNLSETEPAEFLAFYPLTGEELLLTPIDER